MHLETQKAPGSRHPSHACSGSTHPLHVIKSHITPHPALPRLHRVGCVSASRSQSEALRSVTAARTSLRACKRWGLPGPALTCGIPCLGVGPSCQGILGYTLEFEKHCCKCREEVMPLEHCKGHCDETIRQCQNVGLSARKQVWTNSSLEGPCQGTLLD